MADPLHQFQIQKIVDLPDVTLPLVGKVDLAFTNSHLAMTIAFLLISMFFVHRSFYGMRISSKA